MKYLWRVELMKTDTKSIIVEAENWKEAGKLAECAHIQEDPNFSYVDEGTWGMIEAKHIEVVGEKTENKTRPLSVLGKQYLLQVGNKIVSFDAGTKKFGIFYKNAPEVKEATDITKQEEAEKETDGKVLMKCGRCKEYGHGKDACSQTLPIKPNVLLRRYSNKPKEVDPYKASCNDCGRENLQEGVRSPRDK